MPESVIVARSKKQVVHNSARRRLSLRREKYLPRRDMWLPPSMRSRSARIWRKAPSTFISNSKEQIYNAVMLDDLETLFILKK